MLVLGLVLTGLAALVHVFIFYLESIAWTGPRAASVFGLQPEEARATREMAFNQGFYNLFLALLVLLGIVLMMGGGTTAGSTLVLAGAGSMTAAALVLFLSSREHRGAALKQGLLPALGVVVTVLGLVL